MNCCVCYLKHVDAITNKKLFWEHFARNAFKKYPQIITGKLTNIFF